MRPPTRTANDHIGLDRRPERERQEWEGQAVPAAERTEPVDPQRLDIDLPELGKRACGS